MRKLYFSVILFLALILMSSQAVWAQDKHFEEYDTQGSELEIRAIEKYLSNEDKKIFRYEENADIAQGEIVDGNVLVIDSDLKVRGTVNGDVLVIDGDVSLKSGSLVSGDITSINGTIHQSDQSKVKGNQLETKAKNLFPESEWRHSFDMDWGLHERHHYGPYSTLPLSRVNETVIVSYNRVQGMFLGWTIPKKISGKYTFLSVHGFGGYGFKEKSWRYEVGADRWLFNQTDYRTELGAKVYDLTDTKDNWLLTSWENSLSAVLLHRDYQDYYRRTGYEFHASQNLSIFFKGTLGYRNDQYESVEKNTNWALFGKRDFRENPVIEEGNMRSLYGELYFDNRNNIEEPTKGWFAKLGVETSNSGLNSDFSFNQYIFELRRYQPLGRYERLDMRFKLVTSEGQVPVQKLYQLGGVGTMRGFSYKSLTAGPDNFGGDRMLLANFEYNLSPKSWGSEFLFFDDMRYILFVDVGNVWNRAEVAKEDSWDAGFSHLKATDLKSNFGLAISSNNDFARVSLAKRADTNVDPLVFTIRLSKPF